MGCRWPPQQALPSSRTFWPLRFTGLRPPAMSCTRSGQEASARSPGQFRGRETEVAGCSWAPGSPGRPAARSCRWWTGWSAHRSWGGRSSGHESRRRGSCGPRERCLAWESRPPTRFVRYSGPSSAGWRSPWSASPRACWGRSPRCGSPGRVPGPRAPLRGVSRPRRLCSARSLVPRSLRARRAAPSATGSSQPSSPVDRLRARGGRTRSG